MARQFTRGMRRKTQWGGFGNSAGLAVLPEFVALTAGTPAILSSGIVISGGVGLLDEESTVTRTIGQFAAILNSATAALDGSVAVGCVVSRDEAVIAGVASLPSPEDDPDAEWLYYGVFGLHNPIASGLEGAMSLQTVRADFDVRSQRIVRVGSTVVWIAESESVNVDVLIGGRYLVKLT